jgi:hypothetical protein
LFESIRTAAINSDAGMLRTVFCLKMAVAAEKSVPVLVLALIEERIQELERKGDLPPIPWTPG